MSTLNPIRIFAEMVASTLGAAYLQDIDGDTEVSFLVRIKKYIKHLY